MKNSKNMPNPIRPLPGGLPALPLDAQAPSSAFDSEKELPIRECLRIGLKYRTIILTCAVVGFLVSILYAFAASPQYTTSARIRINTYQPLLGATNVESVLQEKSKEANYLETQIQEIASYSLADKVLGDEKVQQMYEQINRPGWFSRLLGKQQSSGDESYGGGEYQNSLTQIQRYLRGITVTPVRRTSLVSIKASAGDAEMSAYIANLHASSYIDWVREKWVEQQSHSLRFLRKQSEELRQKVVDLEKEMAEYAEDNSIIAVNKDENITAQRMAQLNRMLTDLTAKKVEVQNRYQKAIEGLGFNSAGFDDDSTLSMRAKLAELEAEYQQLSAKFTPAYPRMKQLNAQILGLKKSIHTQREQIIQGLKSSAEAVANEEQRLIEELERQKSRTFDLARREVQYNVLQRELESSRELLQNVLRQIKETALAVEGKSSNISIVDPAVIPERPSAPRKKIIVLCGLFLGLIGGVALATLLNMLDNTIRTPEDLQSLLALPNLGVIPSFESEQRRLEPPIDISSGEGVESPPPSLPVEATHSAALPRPLVFLSEPRSLAAEAYRTIRTGILLSQAGEPPRTILITSAQSSEGKTTTSINIAASLAGAGARVALIDADLRRPSLASYLGLERYTPGLVEVITGQSSLESVGLSHLIKRVTVFAAGSIPPNPAELLGSLEMASILDRLSAEFDYVLIDSPPVLPVTDSVILSRYVDGVVMVVKGGNTPQKVVRDARDRLQSVGARILGSVLNDVDLNGTDYYYYNRYYHSYYQDDDVDDEQSGRISM